MEKKQADKDMQKFFVRLLKVKQELRKIESNFDSINREDIYRKLEEICDEFDSILKQDDTL